MDGPFDIRDVILKLTTGSPRVQEETINHYFTPTASFKHPFCSVATNRQAILRIYQWYKIMSPHIDISVNSIAYDEANRLLYVNISQVFAIWFVPFYRAPVSLVTLVQLERGVRLNEPASIASGTEAAGIASSTKEKYFISFQNDLYQVDQWIRFLLPWSIGTSLVLIWQWIATLFCIIGAMVCYPVRRMLQNRADCGTASAPNQGSTWS